MLPDATYVADIFVFSASTEYVQQTDIARVTLNEGGSYLLETIPEAGPGSPYDRKHHYEDEPEYTYLHDYAFGKYTMTKGNAATYTLDGNTLTLTPKDGEAVTVSRTVQTTTANKLEIFSTATAAEDETVTLQGCSPVNYTATLRDKGIDAPRMTGEHPTVSFIDISTFGVAIIGYEDGYTEAAVLTLINGHNLRYRYNKPGMGYSTYDKCVREPTALAVG